MGAGQVLMFVLQTQAAVDMSLIKNVLKTVDDLDTASISADRQVALDLLVSYVQGRLDQNQPVKLNFICTHNSRRSQLSQVWALTAAHYYGLKINSFSGGVEVTEFNTRAVEALKRSGFEVTHQGQLNPRYSIRYSTDELPIICFSKVYDDGYNPKQGFAAVMTCSHADENCPLIVGAEARIPVRYEDPKAFDNTDLEAAKYDERSRQIATEMFYVFSKVSKLA